MTFEIQHDASLASLNTLGLDVNAEYLAAAHTEDEVREAIIFARQHDCELTVLGAGSNVVIRGPISGLVVVICIPGVSFDGVSVEAGAGENWHKLVMSSMEQGLSGIENLALIPGSVGAAPIQNIGAYGVELDSVFHSLSAVDRDSLAIVELNRQDCRFGYRDSVFRREMQGRLVITSVQLDLSREFRPNLSYDELRRTLDGQAEELTPEAIAEAVCQIRSRKLPDPSKVGNVGSFFKNPEISPDVFIELERLHPGIPHWKTDHGVKLAAAWLIEQCGLKGYRQGGAQISNDHALVVINTGGATADDVMRLAAEVQERVGDRFDLAREIEPILI